MSIVSSIDEIIGIEIVTIITFPPKSTLEAIALSPASLHILTANSVKNAIPVIFISIFKNSWLVPFILFTRLESKSTIPDTLSRTNKRIKLLAISDMYTANSGLYCFIMITITTAYMAIPMIFTISIIFPLFLKYPYKSKIVLTVLNNVLIS